MADNTNIDPGASPTVPVASDDIGGVAYQRVKISVGADGAATDVSTAAPLPVDGPVTDAQLRATPVPVSGTVTATPTGTQAVSHAAATQADGHSANIGLLADASSASTLTGLLKAIKAAITGTVAVSGTFWQATQPVSGTVTANVGTGTQPVSGTITANAGTGPFPVSDNAGSLTVDAPVGTPAYVRLSDGSAAITTLPVSLAALPALVAGTANIGDVDVLTLPALPAGTNAIGKLAANSGVDIGDVDVTSLPSLPAGANAIGSLVTPTSGGALPFSAISGASTNATSVKGSAGQLYGWHLRNVAAYDVFLKLYDSASAPTPGAGTPVMRIAIPAGSAANLMGLPGIQFSSGIGFSITKLVADADATNVAASDLTVNLFYK